MKKVGALYKELCSEENIRLALDKASKGKGHYREVQEISKNPDVFIFKLRQMLLDKAFKTSRYDIFIKESGGKLREIHKLPFYPDRIIHHCIIQVVQKLWISLLIRDTFSTIPGRGIHDGVNRVKLALKDAENTKYCLKFDIKKYYPSIDHEVLKLIIRRKIKDNDFLELIDHIIDSAPGIPIGNYVSQWFGNIYLTYFDHFCKEELKCRYYYRYCDDIVILNSNKAELHAILVHANHYLNEHLNLSIKPNYQVFPVNIRGIDFLGYRFFRGYTLVRKRIVSQMKRKLKYPKSMASYWGWLKHADSYRLTNKYFNNERKFEDTAR